MDPPAASATKPDQPDVGEDLPLILRGPAGRLAHRPLVRLLYHALLEVNRNNVFGLASQLAYGCLFAIFPFFICLVALASFLPVHDLAQKLLWEIQPFVPPSGYALIADNVEKVVLKRHAGLLSLGFALALWSCSSALMSLLTGMNLIYGVVDDRRSFLVTRGLVLALTVAVGVTGILGIIVIVGGGSAGAWFSTVIGHPEFYSHLWRVLRWPVAAAMLLGVVLILFRVLPDVKLRWRDLIWGALSATVGWVFATVGFSTYLAYFPNFGAAYGTLGTVIILMTWLYINATMLFLGAQINALLGEARGIHPRRRAAPNVDEKGNPASPAS
jgi:membrane protein